MKTLGLMILLLTQQFPSYAQTDKQTGVIVFYTTDNERAGPPVIYSNGRKIGEVTRDQAIRLVVDAGTHEFRLADAVLPVSIGPGQEVFLRVTRTAFFIGSAIEANASPRTFTPNLSATAVSARTTVPAPQTVSSPETAVRTERIPQASSARNTPGVLRCSFTGTLIVQAALQPASPVVGRIRCGDAVVLIDTLNSSPHIRTKDGRDGYILGLNLGQWTVEPATQAGTQIAANPAPAAAAPSATRSIPAKPETPATDLFSSGANAPSTVAVPSTLARTEAPDISSPSAPKAPSAPTKATSREATPDVRSKLPPETGDYVIGPEDVLSIIVWHEPELSTKVTVRSDGKIGLALIDEIQASGLTPLQLKERITTEFKKFLQDPSVYVIPLEIHSQYVYIVGSVAKPGIYPLGNSMRVTELLVRAGGFIEFAKPEGIVIVRRNEFANQRFPFNYKRFLEGKAYEQDVVLQSGDMVVVP